jgi:transcription antitermination factor NusG
VTDKELENIKKQVIERNERGTFIVPYRVWDLVTLKDGNFIGAVWVVREVNWGKGTLIVNIEMLWRLTPVMISFDKVELSK